MKHTFIREKSLTRREMCFQIREIVCVFARGASCREENQAKERTRNSAESQINE